jgi:lysozyme family protein
MMDLIADYTAVLPGMLITRPGIEPICQGLVAIKGRYVAVERSEGVRAAWLMACDYRESSNDPTKLFANGDPLDRASTHVPAGLGPYTGPEAWTRGCIASLRHDHVTAAETATAAAACARAERWNGLGPREHGRRTGYVLGGTNLYTGGGYPSDRRWDPDWHDNRFGVAPIMLVLGQIDPSLAIPGWPAADAAPAPDAAPPLAAAPDRVAAAEELQRLLNAAGYGPLAVDGSVGRQTRAALRAFQAAYGLAADGVAGPLTLAALAPFATGGA